MKRQTANIYMVIQVEIPSSTCLKDLNVGLANCHVMQKWDAIADAKISTWWVEGVEACNSRYVTCQQCNRIELVGNDAVILDGKPLCILCSAQFTHGEIPQPE